MRERAREREGRSERRVKGGREGDGDRGERERKKNGRGGRQMREK